MSAWVSPDWKLPPTVAIEALLSRERHLPRTRAAAHRYYRAALDAASGKNEEYLRQTFYELGRRDFFFFICYCLNFQDFKYLDNDWVFHMCREVQAEPWWHLDLWSRGHYKTTLLTVGYTLWESLYNPELTTAIFTMTFPQVRKIYLQIVQLLEGKYVRWIYRDVLWEKPLKDAPSWSIQGGLCFRRNAKRREMTIEFHRILALPTGAHFDRLRLDDIVDQRFTTNAEMVDKAHANFQLMTPLRAQNAKVGIVGTRYGNNDLYERILDTGRYTPRVYTPTADGEEGGELLLFSRQELDDWLIDLGAYQASCQLFQRPQALSKRQLSPDWLREWNPPDNYWTTLWRYILVDPASKKGKKNDFTAMVVVGLSAEGNVYLIDAIRDQLNPTERADMLFELVGLYSPRAVFYEESGLSSDVHHLNKLMDERTKHFPLFGVQAGGNKDARIDTLQPLAAAGHLFVPPTIIRQNAEGQMVDVLAVFRRYEWNQWPHPLHDDMLDALARVTDGSCVNDPELPRKKFEIPLEFPPQALVAPRPRTPDRGRWDGVSRRRVR